MKINTDEYRVLEGDEVDLKKWPTKVEPVYKSKECEIACNVGSDSFLMQTARVLALVP